jgi:hypothetical protein
LKLRGDVTLEGRVYSYVRLIQKNPGQKVYYGEVMTDFDLDVFLDMT